jgi:hypothetical protein
MNVIHLSGTQKTTFCVRLLPSYFVAGMSSFRSLFLKFATICHSCTYYLFAFLTCWWAFHDVLFHVRFLMRPFMQAFLHGTGQVTESFDGGSHVDL